MFDVSGACTAKTSKPPTQEKMTNAEMKMKIRAIEKEATTVSSLHLYCKRRPKHFMRVLFCVFEEFGVRSFEFDFCFPSKSVRCVPVLECHIKRYGVS